MSNPPAFACVEVERKPMEPKAEEVVVLKATTKRKREENSVPAPAKKIAEILNGFECPVCYEYPRAGPLHGCDQGHLLCQSCVKRVKACPVCKSPNLKCRNVFAEKIVEAALHDVPMPCKFGCSYIRNFDTIHEHEKLCNRRIVPCPWAQCAWRGPALDLVKHGKQKQCFSIALDKFWHQSTNTTVPTFTNHVGDFPHNLNVYAGKKLTSHWRPVLCAAKKFSHFWVFAHVRHSAGNWHFVVSALASQEYCDRLTFKLTIRAPPQHTLCTTFSFEGKVGSFERSEQELMNGGHMLALPDEMIKPLKDPNSNSLLSYDIEIREDDRLQQDLHQHQTSITEMTITA